MNRHVAATVMLGVMLGGRIPSLAQTPSAPPAAGAVARGTVVPEVSRKCWLVFQAKNDDYWFGSDGDGVFRYDGKAITRYTTADGLSGDSVRGIQGDKEGNVYFTTFAGICKYDGRVFTTIPVTPVPADDPSGGWRLDPDDLWFTWFTGMPGSPGTEGPYRYDGTHLYHLKLPASEHAAAFRAAAPTAKFSPYEVYSIYRDSRGHIWIGTGSSGVCRYDGRTCGWLYEKELTLVPGGGSFGIRSVIEDKDGAFWICNTSQKFRVEAENKDGKVVYTKEKGINEKTPDDPMYFQGAVRDAKGVLWFSPYGGGIWRYDGTTMTNYPVKDDGQDTQVFRIFLDNHGGLWLGTPTAGPYRFNGDAFEKCRGQGRDVRR